MGPLQAIDLNAGWQCEYVNRNEDRVAVPALNQWALDGQKRPSCCLRRSFTLSALDFCVRYSLLINHAPQRTQVYVNGQQLEVSGGPPAAIDITDLVALGENEVSFWVEAPVAGAFSGVRLQPLPCE